MTSQDDAVRVPIGIYLDDILVARLRQYARSVDASVSGLVAAALIEYLDARADEDGSPLPSSDPIPSRRRHRGRPTKEEATIDRKWRADWSERIRRQRGRPVGPKE